MGETTSKDVFDEIDFLARSANRVQLLYKLSENNQLARDELKAGCDASRTTLQRNLEALEESGWIQNTNRSYKLTTKGDIAIDHFMELIDVLQVVEELEPFLKWIPREEFDLDLQLLADAELTVATPNNPYAPVNEHVETLKTAQSFRGILSVVGRDATETAWERAMNDEAEHELVVEAGAVKTLCEDPHYKDMVKEAVETGRYRIYIYNGSIPYYLGLLDETVQIGVEDDEGVPKALIKTDTKEAHKWAEETYKDYKQQAEPFYLESQ